MRYIFLVLFFLLFCEVSAQVKPLKQAAVKANNILNSNIPLQPSEVSEALREALREGSKKAVASASQENGFNTNDLIRISFPQDAIKMEAVLLKLGMNKQIDKFEEKMNRSAEIASKNALKILLEAIYLLTLDEALAILHGEDNAATIYLQQQSSDRLFMEFKPLIQSSMKDVQLIKYWAPLISKYNSMPLTKKVNTDLEEYITIKAIDGLFLLISIEEKNIRNNPEYRVSDLLKKVFN